MRKRLRGASASNIIPKSGKPAHRNRDWGCKFFAIDFGRVGLCGGSALRSVLAPLLKFEQTRHPIDGGPTAFNAHRTSPTWPPTSLFSAEFHKRRTQYYIWGACVCVVRGCEGGARRGRAHAVSCKVAITEPSENRAASNGVGRMALAVRASGGRRLSESKTSPRTAVARPGLSWGYGRATQSAQAAPPSGPYLAAPANAAKGRGPQQQAL